MGRWVLGEVQKMNNPQQLQAVLQVIFDRLKVLEDEIEQLKKEMGKNVT
jgi:hypothetical protein